MSDYGKGWQAAADGERARSDRLRREAIEVGQALVKLCDANDLDSALDAVLRIQASRLLAAAQAPRKDSEGT